MNSNISGNGLVFYAAQYFGNISKEPAINILISHLAMADFTLAWVYWVPIATVSILKKWALGLPFCFISAMVAYTVACTVTLLLVAISLAKVIYITNPFMMLSMSRFKIHGAITGIWLLNLLYTMMGIGLGWHAYFDPYVFSCVPSGITNKELAFYADLSIYLTFTIPLICIVFLNITILIIAWRKTRNSERRTPISAILTVSCISLVFDVSIAPFTALTAMVKYKPLASIPTLFFTIQRECYLLNIALNPIVYTLTSRSFKEFVLKLLQIRKKHKQVVIANLAATSTMGCSKE